MNIFLTGFIQVFFVSINVYFLSKEIYIGVLIFTFLINIIWTYNVKSISVGNIRDRMYYVGGATLGSLSGLWLSVNIIKLI